MRKLLWVGDAGVPSGFARATHEILDVLRHTWDVTVLGMNYQGDPHSYPYPIWAAVPGGDGLGVGRLIWLMDKMKKEGGGAPEAVVFQNDPWNIHHYTNRLDSFKGDYGDVLRVGFIAVDAKHCMGTALNGLDLSIFWTKFGEEEARRGGHRKPSAIVPLGVDTDVYSPGDRREARKRRFGDVPDYILDAFIVGNVNRNQPRKRLDLTIEAFALWLKNFKHDDAYLYLHVAPTGDKGFECQALMDYYGVGDRLILVQPQTFYGITEQEMADTYRSFDVQISTTQGEGFGLTSFEGMACGIPQIVPEWSALGELLKHAAVLVPCSSTAVTPGINTIGGVADREQLVMALERLYENKEFRADVAKSGYGRACEDRFRWTNVGGLFEQTLDQMLAMKKGVPATV